MHDFLTWAGFYTGNILSFWSTPIGLLITTTICICSTVHVVSSRIDDCLFERVWHSCVAIIAFCAIIVGVNPDNNPHYIVKILLVFWLVRQVYEVIVKLKESYGNPNRKET